MSDTTLKAPVTDLIEGVIAFARTRSDIRAVAIVGSRARTDHPADRWADTDFLIFATDPERYLGQTDWMKGLGQVRARSYNRTVSGDDEWLVVFANDLDADFVFMASRRTASSLSILKLLHRFPSLMRLLPKSAASQIREAVPTGARMLARGIRVLIDKDGLFRRMQAALGEPQPWAPPTAEQFLACVNDFWCLAAKTAGKTRRGELYVARHWFDFIHQTSVLRMLEWHARIVHGSSDTWHAGRFLEEWADPRAVRELRDAFPHYDEGDIRRSMLVTMELFRWLTRETAEGLRFTYPEEMVQGIARLTHSRLASDS
jgi:aminoglycoside 6-adenylyltransferase